MNNMYQKSLKKDKEMQKLRKKNIDMHQALEKITNICEDTPERSKIQILDDALNEIWDIAKQYDRPEEERE